MTRVYCDRCKKQKKKSKVYFDESEFFDKEYIGSITKVENGEGDVKYLRTMDLCEKCQEELNRLVVDYVKSHCKK